MENFSDENIKLLKMMKQYFFLFYHHDEKEGDDDDDYEEKNAVKGELLLRYCLSSISRAIVPNTILYISL